MAAERYLASAPNRNRGASANLGTLVHAVADAESRGEGWPELGDTDPALVMAYAEQFNRWRDDFRPEFVLSEVEIVAGDDVLITTRFNGGVEGFWVVSHFQTDADAASIAGLLAEGLYATVMLMPSAAAAARSPARGPGAG